MKLFAALPFILMLACGGPGFDKPLKLGDRMVDPDTLNDGRDQFNRFCATCHGYDGKADTTQGRQLDPHPRDLTLGQFKRVATPGALPTDAELAAVITHGIPPGMPAWPQLEGKALDAVIQYVKTFSQRWNTEATPPPKKSDGGAMNVLPRDNDAASFRAAYEAVGHEPRSAGASARTSGSPTLFVSMEVSDANAARTLQVQPPQVSR